MRTHLTIGPFLGLNTVVAPELIPADMTPDCLNVALGDGALRQRYGFRAINSETADRGTFGACQASYGFFFLDSYTGSGPYTNVQEYLSLERRGGTTRPYSVNPATGARTEIKSGTSHLSLSAKDATCFLLKDRAYIVTPGDAYPVYYHVLGDPTSYVPIKVPADPASPLTYLKQTGGGGIPYGIQKFTGVNASTNISYLGVADNSGAGTAVLADGRLQVHLSAYGNTYEGVKVDMRPANAGADLNWQGTNTIQFGIGASVSSGAMGHDPSQTKLTLFTAAGKTISPDTLTYVGTGGTSGAPTTYTASFQNTDPTDWSGIRYVQIEWTGAYNQGTALDNPMYLLTALTVGGATLAPPKLGEGLLFAYSYYCSTLGFESGLSPTTLLTYTFLNGLNGLGTWVRLAALGSADGNVDTWRLYVQTTDYSTGAKTWRLVASTAIGTLTYDYKLAYAEALKLPARSTASGSFPFANIRCGCSFKGRAVWGISGGSANIRHSAAGQPLTLFTNADPDSLDTASDTAPADYTLSHAMDDQPLAMFACGDSLIIMGDKGAYEQSGDFGNKMSACVRIPSSLGCATQFSCCLWKDDFGTPAVAFLSKNAEGIYLIIANQVRGATTTSRILELSHSIRGYIKKFLLESQGLADYSTLRMGVDEVLDALYVIMGRRALVLRRPSLVDSRRYWEAYEWNFPNSGSVANLGFSIARRMRWIRTTGEIDENEWRSDTNAWISGANADAGQPPASIYWTSKRFTSPDWTRVDAVDIHRESFTDAPSVQIQSSRQTATYLPLLGNRGFRASALQQGKEHTFKIVLADGSGAVTRAVADLLGPLGRRPV